MKQPNWKVPLALCSTLFVLGSFAYWLQYSHKPKQEKKDTEAKKPLAIPEDAQIASFRMRGTKTNLTAKCESITQKKCKPTEKADWNIIEPLAVKADEDNLKSFISALSGAVSTETVDLSDETPESRAKLFDEYGLSEAKRNQFTTPMLEVSLENGKKLTVWFGTQHPLGDKYFVLSAVDGKINEKTVFLIASYTKSNFDHDLTYFRDKSLFTFDRTQIEQVAGKSGSTVLNAKKENGKWVINGLEVDTDRFDTALSSISQFKAKDFPGSTEILKGAKSIALYKLTDSKQQVTTLELFEKVKKADKKANKAAKDESTYYLKTSVRPDPVEVELFVKNQLDKKVDDFRKLDLLTAAERTAMSRFKLEGKKFKTPIEFAQNNGKWAPLAPTDSKMDPTKLTALLDLFMKDKISKFVSPIPAGAAAELTLTMGTDQDPAKFHWKAFQIKEKIYIRDLNSKRNEAYEVPFELKNALPVDGESWIMKK